MCHSRLCADIRSRDRTGWAALPPTVAETATIGWRAPYALLAEQAPYTSTPLTDIQRLSRRIQSRASSDIAADIRMFTLSD